MNLVHASMGDTKWSAQTLREAELWEFILSMSGNGSTILVPYVGRDYEEDDRVGLSIASSLDRGASWTTKRIETDSSREPFISDDIRVLESAVTSTAWYVAYISVGSNYSPDHRGWVNVLSSLDDGETWRHTVVARSLSRGSEISLAADGPNLFLYVSPWHTPADDDTRSRTPTVYFSDDMGAAWSHRTVDERGGVGTFGSIAVDEAFLYVAYFDEANGDLLFARTSRHTNDAWQYASIDSDAYVGLQPEIAAYGDRIAVTYFDDTNRELKYAQSVDRGVSWSTSTIDAYVSGEVVPFASVALNENTTYVVYRRYFRDSPEELRFRRTFDGGETWQ